MPDVIDLTNDAGPSTSNAAPTDAAARLAAQQQLRVAIAATPDDRLRHVVQQLADANPAFEQALVRELVVTRKRTAVAAQIVTRWEVCLNCKEVYDTGGRRLLGECAYHTGRMQPDYKNGFVDWDEDCHGPINTAQNRRDYPDNFLWSCCQESGTAGGCKEARHVPGGHKSKRARY